MTWDHIFSSTTGSAKYVPHYMLFNAQYAHVYDYGYIWLYIYILRIVIFLL